MTRPPGRTARRARSRRTRFTQLQRINTGPTPSSVTTTETLWTEPHISEQMLRAHLDDSGDAASRNPDVIESSGSWITEEFGVHHGTTVADLGCGPGLCANPLPRTGVSVLGIDFSARSIDYA